MSGTARRSTAPPRQRFRRRRAAARAQQAVGAIQRSPAPHQRTWPPLATERHRLSKLLLRHGAVYDATAWTRAHDAWLRKQRFQDGPLAIVFDDCYNRMVDA